MKIEVILLSSVVLTPLPSPPRKAYFTPPFFGRSLFFARSDYLLSRVEPLLTVWGEAEAGRGQVEVRHGMYNRIFTEGVVDAVKGVYILYL